MRLLKSLFVLSAVILFVMVAIFPLTVGGLSVNSGKFNLPVAQPSGPGVQSADGGAPVPIPWRSAASPLSRPSVLTADGGAPVPIPWRSVASPLSRPSVLTADGGAPVPIPWRSVAV